MRQNREDTDGSRFATLTGLPAHTQFAKDWTFGVSWRSKRDWLVRLEQHWVDGTAWLAPADNPDPSKLESRWRLLLLQVTYQFSLK